MYRLAGFVIFFIYFFIYLIFFYNCIACYSRDAAGTGIKAKVDTGARSSALHTAEYEIYETAAGDQRVRFVLHPIKGSQVVRECDAPVTGIREVKDSGGHAEQRPFITTTATIGLFSWPIDISLTNREGMRFRMLLGRAALKGYFVVDPDFSYLMSKSLLHCYKSPTR